MTRRSAWNVRAVVFDFDGTLFDTREVIVRAFQSALRACGYPAAPRPMIERLIGRPLSEMIQTLRPGMDAEGVENFIRAYRRAFAPVAAALAKPTRGMVTCLDVLRQRGVRLAIVTHRLSDGARLILDAHGLTGWFDVLLGLEHIERLKPDPAPLHQALERLAVEPANAAAVGDTPDDMRAGRAAGMWTIGVAGRRRRAEWLKDAGAHRVVRDFVGLQRVLIGAP